MTKKVRYATIRYILFTYADHASQMWKIQEVIVPDENGEQYTGNILTNLCIYMVAANKRM